MKVRFEGREFHCRTSAGDLADGLPVVIYVHGAGGNQSHWLGQFRALRSDVHQVLIDLPGHGLDHGPPAATVADYADWLRGFVAELGVEADRVVLVGHSMGGAVVTECALRGMRVAALVLVASGARLRTSPALFELMHQAEAETWADTVMETLYYRPLDPVAAQWVRRELMNTPRALYINDFSAAHDWDALDRVAAIESPTLILTGTADMLTPVKYAHFLAEKIRGSRLVLLPDTGHMPMIEAGPALTDAVDQFILTVFPNPVFSNTLISKEA